MIYNVFEYAGWYYGFFRYSDRSDLFIVTGNNEFKVRSILLTKTLHAFNLVRKAHARNS